MLNAVDISGFDKIKAKTIPTESMISSGHRACQGCVEILAMGMVTKAAGPDIIVANATGCMEIVTSSFPQSAWKVPWMHVAFENTAAVASGIEAGLKALQHKGKHKGKLPKVFAFGGDGATVDIGLQSLSGAMERGHEFVYICLDNEAYMNTGVQRSSSTPYGAMTTTSPPGKESIGQHTLKKNVPAIAAAHNIPYVATACPGYHMDLMNKVRKAMHVKGPAYIHVFCTCPTGWGNKPEMGVELGRMAVKSKIFPLYEVVGGKYTITKKIKKPISVLDYLKLQRRFRHLKEEDVSTIQARVDQDYARLEAMEAMTGGAAKEEPEETEA